MLAAAAQSLAGCTSVALSPDGRTACITTNGGMFWPDQRALWDAPVHAPALRWGM